VPRAAPPKPPYCTRPYPTTPRRSQTAKSRRATPDPTGPSLNRLTITHVDSPDHPQPPDQSAPRIALPRLNRLTPPHHATPDHAAPDLNRLTPPYLTSAYLTVTAALTQPNLVLLCPN